MTRRTYDPMTYVVRWGDIWKAGYASDKSRWRKFELRGAEVVNVTRYRSGLDALAAETLLERWLSHLGHPAFDGKSDEARRLLGTDGGGWTECYCLCRMSDSHERSHSGSIEGLLRTGRTGLTNADTSKTESGSLVRNAHERTALISIPECHPRAEESA